MYALTLCCGSEVTVTVFNSSLCALRVVARSFDTSQHVLSQGLA